MEKVGDEFDSQRGRSSMRLPCCSVRSCASYVRLPVVILIARALVCVETVGVFVVFSMRYILPLIEDTSVYDDRRLMSISAALAVSRRFCYHSCVVLSGWCKDFAL